MSYSSHLWPTRPLLAMSHTYCIEMSHDNVFRQLCIESGCWHLVATIADDPAILSITSHATTLA